MPNVDLLCLITGTDIDGSVCASEKRRSDVVARDGVRGNGERRGRDWFRLLVRKVTPFSVASPGGGEATEALGHCRTKWPAILSSWSGGFAWGGSEGAGRGRPSDTGN